MVVPVYDEEENVRPRYEALKEELEKLGKSWEVIVVDDGSRDGTFGLLKQIYVEDIRLKVVRLRRNFGQTSALAAGFDRTQGEMIVTIDGDLQNDPADISRLLDKLDEGYDVVSGWRRNRKDSFLTKRLPSRLSNKLARWMTGSPLHDYGCTLKAYRREIIDQIRLYSDFHRYIPVLASSIGARLAELEVKHHPRTRGKSKYGISRLPQGMVDLLTIKLLISYFTKPMQLFGGMGLFTMALGFMSGIATVVMKVVLETNMTGNPLLYLTLLFAFLGVQFIGLGFLGELSTRTYHETQRKPTYVVREVLNRQPEAVRRGS